MADEVDGTPWLRADARGAGRAGAQDGRAAGRDGAEEDGAMICTPCSLQLGLDTDPRLTKSAAYCERCGRLMLCVNRVDVGIQSGAGLSIKEIGGKKGPKNESL